MQILVIQSPDPERIKNVETQMASQIGYTKPGLGDRYPSINSIHQAVPAEMDSASPRTGISKSFKKCVRIALDRGWPEVIILEDDVLFTHQLALGCFLSAYYKFNVGRIGLFLGGFYEATPIPLLDNIARLEGKVAGLQAVIISQDFYLTILEADERMNLDSWLSQVAKVPIYSMYPMHILQQDGYSYGSKQKTHYTENLHLKFKIYGRDNKS